MFAPNDLTTLFKLLSLKCHELFMQSFWHDSSKIRTCDLRIKSPLLYQLSYRVYTKSLRSKDFSDPLTSIARRRGSNYINKSASIHDCPFGCGPIGIGLVPQGGCGIRTHARFYTSDGFQDRSLQPDLGNPPQINHNQYLALADDPARFRCRSVIASYSGCFSRSPSILTRKSCQFGRKSVH